MDQQRKAFLLKDFNERIAPRKLQLAALLPQLWQQCYGGLIVENAGQKLPVSKRPSGTAIGGPVPDPKRAKLSDEHSRRVEEVWKTCMNILTKKLLSQANAKAWFGAPVDPVKLQIPTYFQVITHPMDLGTIKNKLTQRRYNSPLEFRDDVRLVWSNAMTFNPNNTPVYSFAALYSDTFEKAWATERVEWHWMQLDLQANAAAPVHQRCASLQAQLKRTAMEGSTQPQGDPTDLTRDMPFLEKRKLSIQLGELPPEYMQMVLDIVYEDNAATLSGDDEVELDMDALPNITLWKLKDFAQRLEHRPRSMQQQAAWKSGAAGASKRPPEPEPRPPSSGLGLGGSGAAAGGAAAPGGVDHAQHRPGHAQGQGHAAAGGAAAGPGPGSAAAAAAVKVEPTTDTGKEDSGMGDSGQDSPQDVKGSTMDGPAGPTSFMRDNIKVDESATAGPGARTAFLKDGGARKAEGVQVNAANWESLTAEPQKEEGEDDDGPADEEWSQFQTMAERQKQREEQERAAKEKAEAAAREKAERERKEAEERERALKEEEERQEQERKREREQQLEREVNELKAQQGTAKLNQHHELEMLTNTFGAAAAAPAEQPAFVVREDEEEDDGYFSE